MSTGFIPRDILREEEAAPVSPPLPQTIQDTGLSEEFLIDLALKILYVQGPRTGKQITDVIKLPFPFVDEQLHSMQQRRFLEVKSTQGASRAGYTFDLTQMGRDRARDAVTASMYVGPAPVPLEQYRYWVGRQSIQQVHVTRPDVEAAFGPLVLNQETLDEVGPAINSGRSMFLHGESGNGKTSIAEVIAGMLGGSIWIPYAIEIDGQIIVIYDPLYHRSPNDASKAAHADGDDLWLPDTDHDLRWVKAARPVVLTGGELTLNQLDLEYDNFTKLYQAPFQVKANGGVLIIDDFGRQRVPPRDLLNRWIVPLEKRIDFLTLHTGAKFPIPFDVLLVIATNIDPKQLVEEAFLRRIHYKIRVESPTVEQYERIFRHYCDGKEIAYEPNAVRQVYKNFYHAHSIAPRGCHPRDIIDHLVDIAKYLETPPTLSQDLVERAGRSYFLDFPTAP